MFSRLVLGLATAVMVSFLAGATMEQAGAWSRVAAAGASDVAGCIVRVK